MADEAPRSCGSCSLCCTVLRVDELQKLGGVPCSKLGAAGEGCSIHATRPGICRRYRCLWLQGRLEAGDRPDRLGAILDLLSEGGMPRLEIREASPGAFARSARLREIAEQFRETTVVRITDTSDVLDDETPYRVLMPGGIEHRVVGDTTMITHPDGREEIRRLPWIERLIRRGILAARRFRLSRWRHEVR